MTIPDLVSRLAKEGVSSETLALVVAALNKQDEEDKLRREKARRRKAASRARRGTVTGQSRDSHGTVTGQNLVGTGLATCTSASEESKKVSKIPSVSSLRSETDAASGIPATKVKIPFQAASEKSDEAQLFARGRQVLGPKAGGFIKKLLAFKQGNVPLARAVVEFASTKGDPAAYLGRVLAGANGQSEPEVVQQGRRNGMYVEKLGKHWKVGTILYDESGRDVGF